MKFRLLFVKLKAYTLVAINRGILTAAACRESPGFTYLWRTCNFDETSS